MKKLLLSLLLVIVMIFSLASCSVIEEILPFIEDLIHDLGENQERIYTDFNPTEKALIKSQVGCEIPFIANDEYYVEKYNHTDENGIHFYTYGNTQIEYEAYRNIIAEYSYVGHSKDTYGISWYTYENDGVFFEISYYLTSDDYSCVDVYVYVITDNNQGGDNGNDQGGSDNNQDNTGGNQGGNDNNQDNTGGNQGGNDNNQDNTSGNQGGNDNNQDNTGGNQGNASHTYTGFTSSEKELFNEFCGFVIPFIANSEYYVEAYTYEDEVGINFYTFGNTAAEFNAYKNNFSIYTFVETFEDDYGDAWYTYEKGGFCIDISGYYSDEYGYVVDVYVYRYSDNSDDNGGNQDGTNHTYTGFTSSEKEIFNEFCGFIIPFIANDEYYLEAYEYEDVTGINYYTFGNTASEFSSYKSNFSVYTFVESFEDEYGDVWYTYEKNGFYIDISYYYYDESTYVIDVYVYKYFDNDDNGNSGNQGGSNNGSSDISGLPEGVDGVFDIDFTKAENVKNVTDQGYYIDGCPTTGSPAVLIIPVEFKDVTAASKGYSTTAIANAFMKNGQCDYYSVYDYYYISSYGQLTLDITVLDYWFKPKNTSSYYANATMDYYGNDVFIGDQLIMDEALAYLSTVMDLSKFDSDSNGIIDAVVLINTLEIGDTDFEWAFRYWNIYTDDYGYYYEYDGVSANDYLWASYQFLYESADGQSFDESAMNTYTYIHEFGHILGADDYYDTAGVNDPMGGHDVMDAMSGDHNAFTKFNLGWLTTSRLVVTDSSVTLTLDDFSKNGDTIIVANSWDEKLGAYQEYYIIAYYTSNGLNNNDIGGGYFARDGIVVYHVNATLTKEEYDGEVYYDILNNNTDSSDDYGTKDNLIEYVLSGNGTYTYVIGDTLPSTKDDNNVTLGYTFTVDALNGEYATITFTKN